jgi:hypothetical protein
MELFGISKKMLERRKMGDGQNGYSTLSMAEFKGAVGAKIENIEADLIEIKQSCINHSAILQAVQQDMAVLMSSGSKAAQELKGEAEGLRDRVGLLEDHEKARLAKSNRMAAIFGAIGGAILSFISHFVTTWITKPK